MREHVAWLDEHYASGRFVVSGRRVPRTGGVIFRRGDDRTEMEALAAADPFVRDGAATREGIQFRGSQRAPGPDPPRGAAPRGSAPRPRRARDRGRPPAR